MTKPIRDFEIEEHGLEYPSYFRGAGIACTEWKDCATGIGATPAEALEDALESLAQSGEWTWDTESGALGEPDPEEYLTEPERDFQAEAIDEIVREALSEIDLPPRYHARFVAHCGMETHNLATDDKSEIRALFRSLAKERERAGFEPVSYLGKDGLGPISRRSWEWTEPDSSHMVSDLSGYLILDDCKNLIARKREEAEERIRESIDESPWYHVTVYVSDEPEENESSYGLSEIEIDGDSFLLARDEEQANKACEEAISQSLFAFRASFLLAYMPEGMTEEALSAMCESLCEGANEPIRALIGENWSDFIYDAISADERGHFLSSYDGEEIEDIDGALRYRI